MTGNEGKKELVVEIKFRVQYSPGGYPNVADLISEVESLNESIRGFGALDHCEVSGAPGSFKLAGD